MAVVIIIIIEICEVFITSADSRCFRRVVKVQEENKIWENLKSQKGISKCSCGEVLFNWQVCSGT